MRQARHGLETNDTRCTGALRAGAITAGLVVFAACGAGTQKGLIKTVVANDSERATAFEAAARALDEHPEYVDEFYGVARRHPATMRRFLIAIARDLREPELAGPTAELLTENPPSLERVLTSTLDAARSRPPARAAIDAAVMARAATMAEIVADNPRAVTKVIDTNVMAVERRPSARAAFLASMRDSAPPVARMLKGDPDTTKVLLGAVVREQDPPAFGELLQKLGVVK
jgi:hypothetical protein